VRISAALAGRLSLWVKLITRLRHIPKVGEFVVETGYRFTVTEATGRSITKLRMEPVKTAYQSAISG